MIFITSIALAISLVANVAIATQVATTPPATAPKPDATLLANLRTVHGALTDPMALVYTGTYEIEGHLGKPHQTMTLAAELVVSIRNGVVAWDSRLGPAGASGAALGNRERSVLSQWSVYTETNGKWQGQVPYDSPAAAHSVGALLPALVLETAVDPIQDPAAADVVRMKTNTGQPIYLRIDPTTSRIVEINWPRAHRRLGDIVDTIRYSDYEVRSGVLVPKTVEFLVYEDTSHYRGRLVLQPQQPAVDAEALNAAATLTPPKPFEPAVASELVAPGLWSFLHAEADARCMVMETDAGLMVFEAPLSSLTGEQLVDAIKARFPDKPLKAVAVSHYHPHYLGGIRAFVAAGCDVYTTPGVEPFVRELLANPFTQRPDRLQKSPRTPIIHVVRPSQELKDSSSAVVMLDIGQQSMHTEEYLIFYFPKSKILFQGDLGYVQPSGTLRIMGRASGMVAAAKQQGWDIATIIQSWPAHDAPAMAWETFVKAVEKR